MKHQKILYTLFFLFFSLSVFGQRELSTDSRRAKKFFHKAEELFSNRQLEAGIEMMERAIDKDPEFVEAYIAIGSKLKRYGELDKAKKYYIKACDIQPNSAKMVGAYLTLADFYYGEGDYDQTLNWSNRVLELKPNLITVIEKAENLKAKAEFGKEAVSNPVTFKPVKMPEQINQFYIHAYPVLTADQNTLIYGKRNGPRNDEDIVLSKKVNGQWSNPVSISENINSQFSEGTCTMSADGKTLVLTSCNRPEGVGGCDLFISYNTAGIWSQPINMGDKVNTRGWESEPSISADGKTLYFTSDRRGGLGHYDIWVTYKEASGEWTRPKNLGEPVNTKGKEVSPFIHADGKTLYFASTEHLGLGGFDIFRSAKLDSAKFSEPENLGYPINTAANDASLFITVDNSKGFYSVYEDKGINYSEAFLYEFEVPKEIRPDKVSTYAKGRVFDAETKKPIHAKINLVDLETKEVIQSVDSDPLTGEYLVVLTEGSEYALYVDEEGYLFKSQFFDFLKPSKFDPMNLDIYLDPVEQGKAVVLNNIFFETNSYKLKDKSRTELDKIALFLKKNPAVKIEFGGHTDNVGSDKENLQLSMKRAESVYLYMVDNGIEPSRLKYKGYGETKPVGDNDTAEGRFKNRRIEFRIL